MKGLVVKRMIHTARTWLTYAAMVKNKYFLLESKSSFYQNSIRQALGPIVVAVVCGLVMDLFESLGDPVYDHFLF